MIAELTDIRTATPLSVAEGKLRQIARALLDGDHGFAALQVAEVADELGRLEEYCDKRSSPASDALTRLNAETARVDWDHLYETGATARRLEPEMLSGTGVGQLLKTLVRFGRVENAIDIGMFTGYSTLAMAEALPAGGRVVGCEYEPETATIARRILKDSDHAAKISVEVGDAGRTLQSLAEEGCTFDLAFLDADKIGYAAYFKQLLDLDLVRVGGLICADNTLLQGEPFGTGDRSRNGDAIAAFNELVAAEDRVEQVMLPLRDGLTLIERRA